MAKKKHLFDWTGFMVHKWVSGTIEDAAKQNIVLTFRSIKPFAKAVYGEFSVTGTAKTIDSITKDATAKTVTVHVTVAYANGNTCTIVYNPPNKGDTVSHVVTNNIP